jgi:hypothetical protein
MVPNLQQGKFQRHEQALSIRTSPGADWQQQRFSPDAVLVRSTAAVPATAGVQRRADALLSLKPNNTEWDRSSRNGLTTG